MRIDIIKKLLEDEGGGDAGGAFSGGNTTADIASFPMYAMYQSRDGTKTYSIKHHKKHSRKNKKRSLRESSIDEILECMYNRLKNNMLECGNIQQKKD